MRRKRTRRYRPGSRRRQPERTPRTSRSYSAVEEEVLRFLELGENAALNVAELIHELDWPKGRHQELRSVVKSLVQKRRLRYIKGKRIVLSEDANTLVRGRISIGRAGFGFIKPEDGPDEYFVPLPRVHGARHGDLVEARVEGRGRFGSPRARVVRIVERDETPVIGRYIAFHGKGGIVHPDNPRRFKPVRVIEAGRGRARDGDRVQVEVSDWGASSGGQPRGHVVTVFGRESDHKARFKALIALYGFHERFPDDVRAEAQEQLGDIPEEELAQREDLTGSMVITIDPESAHDFDDAISLEKKPEGGYRLGVHIADVSWYVAPGSALDREARLRGTSVYTSHGTLPMLPERLSSDLCSLREGVPRRTVSLFMDMEPAGEVTSWHLARSVIKSTRRFSYEEVQQVIEESRESQGEVRLWGDDDLRTMIAHLADLTMRMRERRFQQGGIDLDVPEYKLLLDDDGDVTGIEKRRVLESHHLVEECMLAANRSVTEYAIRARGSGPKAFIYRVHAQPDPDRIEEFALFVKSLGIDWPFGSHMQELPSKALNEWLSTLEDRPQAEIIRIHALRAMAKAEYSARNVGHYGLGFSNYTHFTSPIRRYPDLVVHRLIVSHIEGKAQHGPEMQMDLQRISGQASERERAAQDMERSSLKIRQAEFFARRIGQVYDGVITGILPKGIFVEIEGVGTSGFVAADDLGAVYYDRGQKAFVEVSGAGIWRPGGRMRVSVLSADSNTGEIDLAPA